MRFSSLILYAASALLISIFAFEIPLSHAYDVLAGDEPPILSDIVQLPDGTTMEVDYRVSGELIAPPTGKVRSVGRVAPEPSTALLILAGSSLGMLGSRRFRR